MASGSPFKTVGAAEERQHAAVLVRDLGTIITKLVSAAMWRPAGSALVGPRWAPIQQNLFRPPYGDQPDVLLLAPGWAPF